MFLKAIDNRNSDANKDGVLTAREIFQYVVDKAEGVPYWARRLHGVDQNPVLLGNNADRVIVTY